MKKILLFCLSMAGCAGLAQTTERYVSLNGTHQPPFTSWLTAAQDIKTAVDWANTNNAGDTVWVSNGFYVLPATVIVSNAIVKGAEGQPEKVVISGNGARRCFVLNHSAAELNAVTLSNGYMPANDVLDPAQYGGALYIASGRVLNSVIGWSSNYYFGGGLGINGAGLVSNCTIIANLAIYRSGGGIAMSSNCAEALITDSRICENSAPTTSSSLGQGGGIMIQSGTIERCLIASNYCGTVGGGMTFHSAYAGGGGLVRDSTIMNNIARTSGGGIGCRDGVQAVIISNCLIQGNTVSNDYGGGMLLSSVTGTSTIWGCVIESNVANRGGGVYMEGVSKIQNTILRDNSANQIISGAFLKHAEVQSCLIMNNALISGTSNGNDCAVAINTNTIMENCTIVSNLASGGGIRVVATNGIAVRNCIVRDNSRLDGVRQDLVFGIGLGGGTNYFFNSCFGTMQLPAHQGNFTNDPMFVEAVNNNYRLQKGSPCINTGMNQPWMDNALDIGRRLRLDCFSRKVDMGAYEFVPNGMLFMGK